MTEEIALENGRISNFQGLVTLTLDRVTLHTVVHHSSTSTYMPNFIEIEETFCGRTDGRMHVRMEGSTLFGRLRRVDLTKKHKRQTHEKSQTQEHRTFTVQRVYKVLQISSLVTTR